MKHDRFNHPNRRMTDDKGTDLLVRKGIGAGILFLVLCFYFLSGCGSEAGSQTSSLDLCSRITNGTAPMCSDTIKTNCALNDL
jgi:hypothetical protein